MRRRPARQRKTESGRVSGNYRWYVYVSAAAAVVTIVGFLMGLLGNARKQSANVPQAHVVSKLALPPVAPVLPVEQARAQIGTLLRNEELDRAIEVVAGLSADAVSQEECERVFSFCIKNPQLDASRDRARRIAMLCWDGDRRQKAMEEIALALLRER